MGGSLTCIRLDVLKSLTASCHVTHINSCKVTFHITAFVPQERSAFSAIN